MSHVDEGMLHAYLDGALDELAGAEAQAIREHITGCGECAARLDEARAVRDEAVAILGGVPQPIEVPPLEDLRARAAAGPEQARRSISRLQRLGWAASIVLAVGAGYVLRGGQDVPVTAQGEPMEPTVEPVESQVADVLEEVAAPEESPTPVAGDRRQVVTLAAADMAEPEDVPAEVEPSIAAARADLLEDADLDAPDDAPAAEPAPEVDDVMTDASPRAGLREIAADERVAFADADSLARRMEPGLAGAGARRVSADLVTVAGPPAALERARESIDGAARDRPSSARQTAPLTLLQDRMAGQESRRERRGGTEPGSLVIPGLELISITFIEEGAMSGGVRALQTLEDGEVLELIHLPEGFDRDDLPPFEEDGKTGVIAPRDGGWLIMRAKRTVEELEGLMARLDGTS